MSGMQAGQLRAGGLGRERARHPGGVNVRCSPGCATRCGSSGGVIHTCVVYAALN